MESTWQLNPQGSNSYQTLLGGIKNIMDSMPQSSLSSKMLLLDNWNEWGEGHAIAPSQGNGFGYLQAVRNTFTAKDNTPDYLTPAQQGFGPYDSLYRNFFTGDKNGVIYKDTFHRTGDLHYSYAEEVGIAASGWGLWTAVPSSWTTDGTKLNASGQGNAVLAFTPATNKIYTLSADIQVTGTDSSKWLAMGFTNNDDLYNTWDTGQNAVAWWQDNAVTNQLQTFLGPNGAGGLSVSGGSAGFNHFSIVLDTTGASWKAQWYYDGQLKRTEVFTSNPAISFVGLGGLAVGAFENFSLTVVPEPSSVMLLATGLIGSLCCAWRRLLGMGVLRGVIAYGRLFCRKCKRDDNLVRNSIMSRYVDVGRVLLVFCCLLTSPLVNRGFAVAPPGYNTLTWSDEFTGNSLNTSTWRVDNGPRNDGVNDPAALSVSGGYLTISTFTGADGLQHTGFLDTSASFSQKYGYFETRIKYQQQYGTDSEFLDDRSARG